MVTTEEMQETMPGAMRNTFYGNVSHDEPKECAIIGLIKNQQIVLEDELKEAKINFANIALEKENWSGKFEREVCCRVIEGQISILSKVQKDFEDMLTPTIMTPD